MTFMHSFALGLVSFPFVFTFAIKSLDGGGNAVLGKKHNQTLEAKESITELIPSATDDFDDFIQKHQRKYTKGTPEYDMRHGLFRKSVVTAEVHNKNPSRLWTYDSQNKFADRTEGELKMFHGWRSPGMLPQASRNIGSSALEINASSNTRQHSRFRKSCSLPLEWSWSHLKAAQRFRDQGHCGSCSAIATAAVLEAHHEIHHGVERSFSPQEFISCVQNPEACGGEGGCKGGFMELIMSYVVRHGCHEEQEYPHTSYQTQNTGTCKVLPKLDVGFVNTHPGIYQAQADAPGRNIGIMGYERLPVNRMEPLQQALVQWGPVVVALDATDWFGYGGGVFDACATDPVVNHAVMLMGFAGDKQRGIKYWHLHNTWGPDWGEGGRMKLLRRDDEEIRCGIDTQPELGAACSKNRDGSEKAKPLKPVRVCGTCGLLINPVVPHFHGQSDEASRLRNIRTQCSGNGASPSFEAVKLVAPT